MLLSQLSRTGVDVNRRVPWYVQPTCPSSTSAVSKHELEILKKVRLGAGPFPEILVFRFL